MFDNFLDSSVRMHHCNKCDKDFQGYNDSHTCKQEDIYKKRDRDGNIKFIIFVCILIFSAVYSCFH